MNKLTLSNLPWQDETQIPPVKTFVLTPGERTALEAAAQKLEYPVEGPHDDFIRESRKLILNHAPDRLIDEVNRMGWACFSPALIIGGLPYDKDVVHAPPNPDTRGKSSSLSEALVVGFGAVAGRPYGISSSGNSLVSNICPSRDPEMRRGFSGASATDLGPHIENAGARLENLDLAPDGLVLTGVSKQPGANPTTPIFDARLAFLRVKSKSPELAKCLLEPRFLTKAPQRWWESFGSQARRSPVLIGHPASPSFAVALYDDLTTAADPEAEKALAAFTQALAEVIVPVRILPGRLVMVDNHIAMHGSSNFHATFTEDGNAHRWLQRTFWRRDLRQMSSIWPHEGHVYTPIAVA